MPRSLAVPSRADRAVFPVKYFLPRYGFPETIRLTGAIIIPPALSSLMMRACFPPRSKRGSGNAALLDVKSFVTVVGGLHPALQRAASTANLVFFYSVAIHNASGAFVRVLGNSLADLYGPFNMQVACSIAGGTLIWVMLGMSISSLPLSSRLLHCTSPTPAFLLLSLSRSIRFPISSTIIDSSFLPSPRHKGGSLVAISFLCGVFPNAYLALAFACLASLAKGPEIGARTGVASALNSFSVLVSASIQDARAPHGQLSLNLPHRVRCGLPPRPSIHSLLVVIR
ncbi:hypothetical protein DFH08DRAFT_951374 [Mycena albidolilacea]|uniref:Uncharacterized protein n=1 Tax=Mycena albidolilacea TaxID=1033008 RepID=A0AAD7AJ91_9AGAR|nr:hypothetical protein DFH08DRAFT_951374 [Mycena albidolilacea]